jgi:CHAT domain-containing protein/Tfp pilus assembly protein PilF
MRACAVAFCLILWLAVAALPAGAQVAVDEFAQARDVYDQQGARPALPMFEKLLQRYEQAGDRANQAQVLRYIGNCHKRLGDHQKALEFLNRALALTRELHDRGSEGRTLSNIGLVYWELADYTNAIASFSQAIDIARATANPQLEANALNNRSLVYDEIGDFAHSLPGYQQALSIQQSNKFESDASNTLQNIGGVHLNLGRFREAAGYYRQALAIVTRLQLGPRQSDALGNLGLCQLGLGQMPEAIESFDRAIALARAAGAIKEEADWHKGKGTAQLRLGRYDLARSEHQEAVRVYERAGLKRELVEALSDRGAMLVELGDLTSAAADYGRAVEMARSIGYKRGITQNLIDNAEVEQRRGRFEPAHQLYADALASARESGQRDAEASSLVGLALWALDRQQNTDALRHAREAEGIASSIGATLIDAEAADALADALLASGDVAGALQAAEHGEALARDASLLQLEWRLAFDRARALERQEQFELAALAYKRAIAIIEQVRAGIAEQRFRSGYFQDKAQVYENLVKLLIKLGRADEALQYSERLRAQSYRDLIEGRSSLSNDPREQELRTRTQRLQQKIAEENRLPTANRHLAALTLYNSELLQLQREYQALLDDFAAQHREQALERGLVAPSAAELRSRLGPQEALLEYVVSDDSLAVIVISAEDVWATLQPVSAKNLHSRIELLRGLIRRKDRQDWEVPAASLRSMLIDPIEQSGRLRGVQRLYLVPHSVLHYLPFAALIRRSQRGSRFLAQDYVIDYLPSAAALGITRGSQATPRTLLALAPTDSELPYAQEEVRSLPELFDRPSAVLVGARATKQEFLRRAPQAGTIHLATHGFFNRANPLFSGLQLQRVGNDDGRLEVWEVLDQHLQANLVTLSACDTALASGYFGEVPEGDEFVGLTRAFLTAGSRSVLATLWEVNDRSTRDVMLDFYRRERGLDPATALAGAQRAMLRHAGRFRHPYFWAAFTLVDVTQPAENFARKPSTQVRVVKSTALSQRPQ